MRAVGCGKDQRPGKTWLLLQLPPGLSPGSEACTARGLRSHFTSLTFRLFICKVEQVRSVPLTVHGVAKGSDMT